MLKKLKRICSWCNRVLDKNEGKDVTVTHVICAECAQRFEEEAHEDEVEFPLGEPTEEEK